MTHSLDEFLEIGPHTKRYGHYVAMLCPWHEDHRPSLFVYEDDFFRCVACDEFGDHDRLYAKLENPDTYIPEKGKRYRTPHVPEDLSRFVEDSHKMLSHYSFRKKYLQDRGVGSMIDLCKLGWYEGWFTVPVYGDDGEVKGVVLRSGPQIQKITGLRFLQPVGQKPTPFIPDRTLTHEHDTLAVTFGIFDALVISAFGYPAVTTTGGKNTFDPDWLEFWRNPIRIFPDVGEEETAYKVARGLGWRAQTVFLDYPEGCKDPADYVQTGNEDKLRQVLAEWLS